MNRTFLLPSLAAVAAALASPVARAQDAVPPTLSQPPLSDADALAAQMRIIAAQPTDVGALAQAGELSARLGDLSGAASLFARADKVDPRNGRVKAGMAEVLLRSERPGEALRFFDQAEGYGYPAARFAAERGLAYDLVGQQGRAQRDYRLVLAAGDTPEVRRRYALSLGIAGQGEAALQQLDPLIRRNDRGAWRSRAFILAMQGDVAGATTIATTMMAPGQAQGLAPFFARLASLGSVDRAFAVHFGELRPTSQRLADARLAPALSPLAPETVEVARAMPVAVPVRQIDQRRRRRPDSQLAAAIPVPAPLIRPPAYGIVTPARAATAYPATTLAPTTVAAPVVAKTIPRPRPPEVAYTVPGSLLPRYRPRSSSDTIASATPAAGVAAPAAVARPVPVPVPVPVVTPSPIRISPSVVVPQAKVASPVVAAPTPTPAPLPVPTPQLAPASIASSVVVVRTSAPTVSTTAPTVSTPVVAPPVQAPAFNAAVAAIALPAASEAVLARIAEALAVPGRELAAASAIAPTAAPPLAATGALAPASVPPTPTPTPTPTPAPAPTPKVVAEPARPARAVGRRGEDVASDGATSRATRRQLAAKKATGEETPADAPVPIDRKALARKAAADRKALADRKAAVEAKALADKDAAADRKARKSEPERYWVQVAGGANGGDLSKAWSSTKAKAPALAGRKGWSTPLRATNRVVTGPFKTGEEARAFVNTLKKQGVSAFPFTSEAGQKITRLDTK